MPGSVDPDFSPVHIQNLSRGYFCKGKAGNRGHKLKDRRRRIFRSVNRQYLTVCLKPVHQYRDIRRMVIMPVTDKQRRKCFRRCKGCQQTKHTASQIKLKEAVSRLQQITGGCSAALGKRTVNAKQMQFHTRITAPLRFRRYPGRPHRSPKRLKRHHRNRDQGPRG